MNIFNTKNKIKWCLGCGNYAILKQIKETLYQLGIKKENIVFVSGIGCASRLPYYIDTFGLHGLHGRATAIATGIKLCNPKLSVWVITGDGDLLSIGANHFIHILRRNININILLFNNEIYGLTKGQPSPTTNIIQSKNKSNYKINHTFYSLNTTSLALGANGTFISRTIDNNQQHLKKMIMRAFFHKGTSLVEIYQNCNVFNDEAFKKYSNINNVIYLEQGKRITFGKDKNKKGLIIKNLRPKIVSLNNYKNNNHNNQLLWIHDENDIIKANILTNMFKKSNNILPHPFGVIYKKKKSCYETEFYREINKK